VAACPKDVIALADRKVNVHGYPYVHDVNPDECIGCSSCAIVCPDGCITVYRKKIEE
jgi:2-oxoglutarate ferredoxin oxidoreductase subunit delta